jgi:sarcosine oxidase subunit gamma
MADREILSRSALAELAKPRALGLPTANPGVRVSEVADFAAIGVIARRGKSAEVSAILSRHIGSAVEDAPRRAGTPSLSVAGTAPGQWLVVGRGDAAARLESLRADLVSHAAVTDQGDGRLMVEIAGPRARDALAKGIAIDLDASAFKVGDAAQTSAAHLGLQIALVDETPTFEIISPRSTAGNFWAWLVASAAEYGIEVV